MNRMEFMRKLEALLSDISPEERREALQYYEDYFEDAGAEHEADVIRELGSPEKVAATLKADIKGGSADAGAFTERGYEDDRFDARETPARTADAAYGQEEGSGSAGAYSHQSGDGNTYRSSEAEQEYRQPKTSTGLKILLVALIILIGVPVAIPVAVGLGLAVLGVVVGIFAFFAGLVLGAAIVMFVGIGVVFIGLPLFLASIPAGMLTVGIGLLIFVIGLIGTVATTKLCIVMYPAICRILVNICRWPFYRRKAVV